MHGIQDIDSILSLYSDSLHFASPKIQKLFLDYKTNTITNKNDLKEYFSIALQKLPNLKFQFIDFVTKDNIVILEYVAYPNNDSIKWNVLEKFEFDENGKIIKLSVYYGIVEEKKQKDMIDKEYDINI